MIGSATKASPLAVNSLAQLTLSLLAIVALIFALGWILKRLKLTSPRSHGDLTVIDQLVVGQRERILLIRVGDAQVLIGVGTGGIIGLTPLSTPISVKSAAPGPVFADRLREFMKRSGGST